jgi:hypothetical protein
MTHHYKFKYRPCTLLKEKDKSNCLTYTPLKFSLCLKHTNAWWEGAALCTSVGSAIGKEVHECILYPTISALSFVTHQYIDSRKRGQRRAHIGCLSSSLPNPSLFLSERRYPLGGFQWRRASGRSSVSPQHQKRGFRCPSHRPSLPPLPPHQGSRTWQRQKLEKVVYFGEVATICSSSCLSHWSLRLAGTLFHHRTRLARTNLKVSSHRARAIRYHG